VAGIISTLYLQPNNHFGVQAKEATYDGYLSTRTLTCSTLCTSALFPTFGLLVQFVSNLVFCSCGTLQCLPIISFGKMIMMWCAICVPLCAIGAIAAKQCLRRYDLKPITAMPWITSDNACCSGRRSPPSWQRPQYLIAITGFFPFGGACFIESYYCFSSLWKSHIFNFTYGWTLIVFLLTTVVVACSGTVPIFLCMHNGYERASLGTPKVSTSEVMQRCGNSWTWHWTSFLSGMVTSGYLFLYGAFYFLNKSDMQPSDTLAVIGSLRQLVLLVTFVGIMFGSVSFMAADCVLRLLQPHQRNY
jgi:hypothetical protein